MTTVAEAMAQARRELVEAGDCPHEAHRKTNLLMQHLLGAQMTAVIANDRDALRADDREVFDGMVKRAATEPVHRITGWREFHGLKLALSPATLEPRDDTEAVIDLVLAQIRDRQRRITFADLGTGTGAIALALLSEYPQALAIATDIKDDALETARQNAQTHGLSDRLKTSRGSWFEAMDEPVDFIVSNPPYLPRGDIEGLDATVRDHDPVLALDGGADGLDAYRAILEGAFSYLKPEGFLALEIGHDQAGKVSLIALSKGWVATAVRRDLAGKDRALLISR